MLNTQEMLKMIANGENPFAMTEEFIAILQKLGNPFEEHIRKEGLNNTTKGYYVRVWFNNELIAESHHAIPADGGVYIPQKDILVPLTKNEGRGWCAMRHWATQWNVGTLEEGVEAFSPGGAFSYEQVPEPWKFLEGYIAFQDPRMVITCNIENNKVDCPVHPVEKLDHDYILQTILETELVPNEYIPLLVEAGKFSHISDEKIQDYFGEILSNAKDNIHS